MIREYLAQDVSQASSALATIWFRADRFYQMSRPEKVHFIAVQEYEIFNALHAMANAWQIPQEGKKRRMRAASNAALKKALPGIINHMIPTRDGEGIPLRFTSELIPNGGVTIQFMSERKDLLSIGLAEFRSDRIRIHLEAWLNNDDTMLDRPDYMKRLFDLVSDDFISKGLVEDK